MTSIIAMGVALLLAIGLVVSLGGLSLLIGAVESFFGGPKIKILKSQLGDEGFAFALDWNESKEPAKIDKIKVRLFNPFGEPTQVEVSSPFEASSTSLARDVSFGPGFVKLMTARGFERGRIEIEASSHKDGVNFSFEMKAPQFKKLLTEATLTVNEYVVSRDRKTDWFIEPTIVVPEKSFIAPSVNKGGAALKIATNPEFAQEFQGGGAETAAVASLGATKVNFAVTKVWIEPGCIVCNACENVYPEVFKVLPEGCIVNPNYPMSDGLKILEAAEGCPVEVIKFAKA